jgi:hypothetical protein
MVVITYRVRGRRGNNDEHNYSRMVGGRENAGDPKGRRAWHGGRRNVKTQAGWIGSGINFETKTGD